MAFKLGLSLNPKPLNPSTPKPLNPKPLGFSRLEQRLRLDFVIARDEGFEEGVGLTICPER